jgi:hypothetical protein
VACFSNNTVLTIPKLSVNVGDIIREIMLEKANATGNTQKVTVSLGKIMWEF